MAAITMAKVNNATYHSILIIITYCTPSILIYCTQGGNMGFSFLFLSLPFQILLSIAVIVLSTIEYQICCTQACLWPLVSYSWETRVNRGTDLVGYRLSRPPRWSIWSSYITIIALRMLDKGGIYWGRIWGNIPWQWTRLVCILITTPIFMVVALYGRASTQPHSGSCA
jgi:hypothetical protein